MAIDFGHLREYDLTGETRREYTFRRIRGNPVLVCSPATKLRPEFERAVRDLELETSAKPGARDAAPADPTLAEFNALRRRQIPLFVQHVVRDWRNVRDRSGTSVPFSPEAAAAFLSALPDLLLAEFWAWAINVDNFSEIYDGEAVAKN